MPRRAHLFLFACVLHCIIVDAPAAVASPVATPPPASPTELPEYLRGARGVKLTDDYFCGPYVLWHALNWSGRKVPINDLIVEMGTTPQHGTSIDQLITAMEGRGFVARAVQTDIKSLARLREPFIVYLRPSNQSTLGHFAFCAPIGGEKAVLLDGPVATPPFSLRDLPAAQERGVWDGTAVFYSRGSGGYPSLAGHHLTWHLTAALGILAVAAMGGLVTRRAGPGFRLPSAKGGAVRSDR